MTGRRWDEGVVVVDKPAGLTSHDVVARARKIFKTRAIGHAGTLDPMATGVLVLAVGRATKLVPWLVVSNKRYEATLRLGIATHSLDADGEITGRAEVPDLDIAFVQKVAEGFVGRQGQRAPSVSAIKVGGRRLHERVRRGEEVEPPVRQVELFSVEVRSVQGHEVRLALHCGKGFYVRSFGRDLAEALGTIGHLVALRRIASGPFGLDEAVAMGALADTRPLSLADAAGRLMPRLELSPRGFDDARHGRPVAEEDLRSPFSQIPVDGVAALIHEGALVAVARRDERGLRVVRGFAG